MKDNLNIEKFFQEKFNAFEGEVSPNVWSNIQQGMGATGGVAAATGMSLLLKTALISGGIVAATFGGIYLFSESDNVIEKANDPIVHIDADNLQEVNNDHNEERANTITDRVELSETNEEQVLEEGYEVNEVTDLDASIEDRNSSNDQNINQEGTDERNTGSEQVESGKTDEDSIESNEVGSQEDKDSPSVFTEPKENLPRASLTYEAGDDYAPSTYTFHANAENYSQVLWGFGNGITKTGTTVEHTFIKPGIYDVKMTVKGVEGKDFIQNQEVIIQSKSSIDRVPNAFTPNNDRRNDFFMIFMTEIETFAITIRSAQGEIIYQETDPDFRWYGTNQSGDRVENGTYTYEFFARGYDGSEFPQSGTIRVED